MEYLTPGNVVLIGMALAIGLLMISVALRKPCLHNWEVKDKQRIPSPWEVQSRHPVTITGKAFAIDPQQMATERCTTILACTKCGRLRVVRS